MRCNFISGATAGYNVKLFADPDERLYDSDARIQRTPTLDGNSVLVHNGQTDQDRVVVLVSTIDETQESQIRSIHENDTLVSLSCKYGFFDGAIKRFSPNNGKMTLIFWISEKING